MPRNRLRRRAAALTLCVWIMMQCAAPAFAYVSSDWRRQVFLDSLAALPHYQEDRRERYLAYYGSSYTHEQILRIVNTDNDLSPFEDARKADTSYGTLILVNKYHYLGGYVPDHLSPMGIYGSWGSMDREARAAFASLCAAAAKDGRRIWAVSPYRSYDRQSAIYNSYVAANGREEADTYSARPGYSEHQTGLAVDVAVPGRSYLSFEGTPEFQWMVKHAHEYGFILRYGKGMTYITGYIYEPWHYRYVGVDAATYIWEHDLTFEEYYYYYVIGNEPR